MGSNKIEGKGFTWLHMSEVSDSDLQHLQENFQFHALDYEDIKSEALISKLDTYKHYIFVTLLIPRLDENNRVIGEPLYIFLSADQVVTVTHRPNKELQSFYESCKTAPRHRSRSMSKGTGFFAYKLLLSVFQSVTPIMKTFVRQADELEGEIYHVRSKGTTIKLGRMRRNIVYIRHLVDPQRQMLTTITGLKRPFISEEMHLYFDDLHDLLDNIWLSAGNLKMIIDGLFDVNEALNSYRTNEIITLFTIVTAALMGPTLIAGFYGMNVPWINAIGSPGTVASFYFISLAVILGIVYTILKKKKPMREYVKKKSKKRDSD